jgi:hypothetical protein
MRERGVPAIIGTLHWLVNSGMLLPDLAGAYCGLLRMIVSRFVDGLK